MKKKWVNRFIIGFCAAVVITLILSYLIISSYQLGKTSQAHAPINETPVELLSTAAIYNLVNQQRVQNAVQPLTTNPLATQAAEQKCQNMIDEDYYDHINPKTGVHGYQYAINLIPDGKWFNENLTEGGARTNEEVVQSWLDSPDHKATMLDPIWTDTGLAICHRPSQPEDSHIIVQEFVQIP